MISEYVVAIYLRISDEDKTITKDHFSGESESISGQRIILKDFVEKHEELSGSRIIEVVDDGYSGTNFDRPGIQSLLQRLKEQSVNCIVVKDFSRFGRNYLEVGNYLEQIFPFLGVRFISINDNFDSFKNFGAAGAIDVGFKNIAYEAYSNDLSIKIRSAKKLKAKQGKFVTAFAPYGYVKDPNNKSHLFIDEECASTVRLIYNLFLQGTNKTEIARILNRNGILSPMMVRKKRNENFCRYECNNQSHWTASTVSRILFDQRYIGDGIYGKVAPKTVGNKKNVSVSKENWIIVPNAHAGIIEREIFDMVAVTRKTHRYQRKNEEIPLAKKVICGACNHVLKRIDRGNEVLFHCTTRANTDRYDCDSGYFSEQTLESIILRYLQNLTLIMQSVTIPPSQKKSLISSIPFKMKQTQESFLQKEGSVLKLYESFKAHKITDNQFLKQMKAIEADIAILKDNFIQCEKEHQLALQSHRSVTISDYERIKKKYSSFESLTKQIVCQFIEAVYVGYNGLITVKWKFSDPLTEDMDI